MKEHQQILERLYQLFLNCADPNTREQEKSWSIKQVVGHLLDSLNNNHQRLARYIPGGGLKFPAYDQNVFVEHMYYDSFPYQRLVSLWYEYNLLFLHAIGHVPAEDLNSKLTIGDRPTLSLQQLIDDYFAHMEIHERQVRRILEA